MIRNLACAALVVAGVVLLAHAFLDWAEYTSFVMSTASVRP